MRQIMETSRFGKHSIFHTVPGYKVGYIYRVKGIQDTLFRCSCQRQILRRNTGLFNQLCFVHSGSDSVVELFLCRIGLFSVRSAVFIAYILPVNQKRRVELCSHIERISIDQTVDIPGWLPVLLKHIAHQFFLSPDIRFQADDITAEFFGNIADVVFARFRHGEIILHTEQNRVHMHDFLHQIHLIMGVLPAGNGDSTIVTISVHAAIAVTDGFQFLPSRIPVNIFPSFKGLTSGANPLFIKCDTRSGVRHHTFFAVPHVALLISYRDPVCIGQDFREGSGSFQPAHPRRTPAVSILSAS